MAVGLFAKTLAKLPERAYSRHFNSLIQTIFINYSKFQISNVGFKKLIYLRVIIFAD